MSQETTECVITDVKFKNNEYLGPLIVSFEHGFVQGDGCSARLSCGLYEDKVERTRTAAAVAADGEILYRGPVREDSLCRFLIAKTNKRSREMCLFEGGSVVLSPEVRCAGAGAGAEAATPSTGSGSARMDLSRAFGSKKSKRVADQRERMALNVTHKGDHLVADIEVNRESLESSYDDKSYEMLLPPCNRTALTIAYAYPLSGLLNADELSNLESIAVQIAQGQLPEPKLSPFCERLLTKINSDSIKNLALVLYTHSLIMFCAVPRDSVKKKKETISPLSDMIWNRILRDFMSSGSVKSRTKFMEDKAVAFIMILNFHIGNSLCDVNLLAESLCNRNLTTARIRLVASVVGAKRHFEQDNKESNDVILEFPLKPMPLPQRQVRSSKRK